MQCMSYCKVCYNSHFLEPINNIYVCKRCALQGICNICGHKCENNCLDIMKQFLNVHQLTS